MKDAVHIILWFFVGALVVLVIKNPTAFATSFNSVNGGVQGDAALLTGQVTPTVGANSQIG